MEEVLTRLQSLTADELRLEITQAGLKCGPITATTRSIFEKKLARTLVENEIGGCSRSESDAGGSTSESIPTNDEVVRVERDNSKPLEDGCNEASPESPSMFYGVLPPVDDPSYTDGSPHVYADKQKALNAVMKIKGARFKAFLVREQAENFAKGLKDGNSSPNGPSAEKVRIESPEKSPKLEMANVEKANDFRSPRTQDLTSKLRRAVENGDEEGFTELVWSNPRYLIGSGDNPTIVQEGCRYNVLHVAAKENQSAMAHLILETLQSPEFMHLMYPDDQEDMLRQRINYIVDLYLNTPDKASNETPLHFASKFGCSEVVNVLCSHPFIDKNCRNKYGQTASSVICERKNKNKEIKARIQEFLEDRFFVPLLRATDNTLNPVIGVPRAPGFFDHDMSPGSGEMDDPKNPLMTIRAFVGPLNLSKAEEFYKLWKTPPRDQAKYFHHILKSDPDQGAERVGRELAHTMGYSWAEYWAFLNCFTDLSVEDGLNKLEQYLEEVVQEKTSRSWQGLKSPALLTDNHLHSSPVTSTERTGFSKRNPVCNLMSEFERASLLRGADDSGLGGPASSSSEGKLNASAVGKLDWMSKEEEEEEDASSEDYFTADEDEDAKGSKEKITVQNPDLTDLCSPFGRNRSNSTSSSCSYRSTYSTPEDAEDFWEDIFLAGGSPSKLDNEVLLAVNRLELNQQLYPCLIRWRNTVSSYPESERNRWPMVSVRTAATENQTSTPRRLTHSRLTGSPSFLRGNSFSPVPYPLNSSLRKPSCS